jgi:hypothetical protein
MNPEKMDDATRTELLNAEVDGVATEAQRAALQGLLQWDPSAREELEALRAVADLLGRTPVPEAPDDFTEGVMTAVHRVRERSWLTRLRGALVRAGWSWGPQREDSTNLSLGQGYVSAGVGAPKRSREDVMARQQNMFQRRMIFAGAGVLAVAALVVYFGGYYPPTNEEAYGTIGAAERYRSEQIKAEDVKLDNPEVQAFLQSETFDRIVRDPAAREALTNEALIQAVSNDAFRVAFSQAGKLAGDANKLQAEMAKLNDAATKLDQAYKLNGGFKLNGDANKFQAEMAKLNDAASKLDAAIKFNTAVTLNQSKMQAEMAKLNDAATKLNDANKLNGGASKLNVDANKLNVDANKLNLDANKFQAEMGKLTDAANKLNEAFKLNTALSVKMSDASKIQAEMTKLNDAANKLNEANKLNDASKFQAEMAKLNDAAMNIKMSDAFKLGQSANVNEAMRLQDQMSKLNDSAIRLNQSFKLNDAAKFQAEMAKLNVAALNFKAGDAFKLNQSLTQDALGLRGGAAHQ